MLFISLGFQFLQAVVLYGELSQQTFCGEAINGGIYLLIACSMFCVADHFQRERAMQKILRLQNDNMDMMAV